MPEGLRAFKYEKNMVESEMITRIMKGKRNI